MPITFRQRNSTLNKVFEPFSAVIPARLTWPDATYRNSSPHPGGREGMFSNADVGVTRVIKDGEQIAPYHVICNDVY